jgi:hypothetical protein
VLDVRFLRGVAVLTAFGGAAWPGPCDSSSMSGFALSGFSADELSVA